MKWKGKYKMIKLQVGTADHTHIPYSAKKLTLIRKVIIREVTINLTSSQGKQSQVNPSLGLLR